MQENTNEQDVHNFEPLIYDPNEKSPDLNQEEIDFIIVAFEPDGTKFEPLPGSSVLENSVFEPCSMDDLDDI